MADPRLVERRLVERTWPEVGAPVVVVPVGSTEQHGPHLPLDTDTAIAIAVGEGLVARLRDDGVDAVLAPAIAYGSSGEHEGFPGTISIGTAALELLLLEYGRSACAWASRVLFLTGHGGNLAALTAAVTRLRFEARDVAWLPCAPPPGVAYDAHAGRGETSVMAFLRPASVGEPEPGATASLAELLPALRADGVRAVSPNGVLGDPRGASAEEGRELLAGMAGLAHARVVRNEVGDDGCLVSGG